MLLKLEEQPSPGSGLICLIILSYDYEYIAINGVFPMHNEAKFGGLL